MIGVLACAVVLLIAGLWSCLAATLLHFRRRGAGLPPDILPMTVIKPVKGLDDALLAGFESVVAADAGGKLQLIVALESADDPAYAVARDFAARHPGRDILVLLTGPCRGRMGKAHNMIEALPRAKHPRIVFSDGDTLATETLVRETSAAFAAGCEAVSALPFNRPAPGIGGFFFQVAFNHSFCVIAALSYKLGLFTFGAGAWMGFTRDLIERSGGLDPIAHAIADDFMLWKRAHDVGARSLLLTEPVFISETGTSLSEAFVHLVKWSAIVRVNLPAVYALVPVVNLGVLSAALLVLCEATGARVGLGRALFVLAAASRVGVGYAEDRWAARATLAWYWYPALALVDLGTLVFWAAGFRGQINWRGRRYRLLSGGQSKVIG